MKTSTINGAKDILLVTQNVLKAGGRPRKPLSKHRPKHDDGKANLVHAMTTAAKTLGASRRQLEAAFNAVIDAAWHATSGGMFYSFSATPRQNVQAYDDMELDTREVIRTVGRAAKLYL